MLRLYYLWRWLCHCQAAARWLRHLCVASRCVEVLPWYPTQRVGFLFLFKRYIAQTHAEGGRELK